MRRRVPRKQETSLSRGLLTCDAVQCCGRIPTFQGFLKNWGTMDLWNFGILPHYMASQPRRSRHESSGWRRRQLGPLKLWYPNTQYGVTTTRPRLEISSPWKPQHSHEGNSWICVIVSAQRHLAPRSYLYVNPYELCIVVFLCAEGNFWECVNVQSAKAGKC